MTYFSHESLYLSEYNDACLVCLACAFYWSSLGDGTSGLVAGSRDSEEHT